MTPLIVALLATALNGTWNIDLYRLELAIFDGKNRSEALFTVYSGKLPVRLTMHGKVEERDGKHLVSFGSNWSAVNAETKCTEKIVLFLKGKLSEDGFSDTYDAEGAVVFVTRCKGSIVATDTRIVKGVWRRKNK